MVILNSKSFQRKHLAEPGSANRFAPCDSTMERMMADPMLLPCG
jgi:hypothetical protein